MKPTFSLVDHHGNPVTEASYRGRWTVVLFGFTHCRVVCPRALSRLSEALASADVEALYITVDPDRDTPEVLRQFLETGYPRFTGLTGTAEQTDNARRAFGVFARRRPDPEDPDGYAVPHTAITYLLDPDGNYRTHWTDTTDAGTIAADLAHALEGRS
ncbi:SCO family protein [Amycolatopsis thermoflava]|uniref:SCO family protein n=1 Tax=Amycolatopsis thermoflava TaxID=84480 RepID=UPI0037F74921